MFKIGQQVKYLGYKRNLHGDTKPAELDGKLVPGKIYTIQDLKEDATTICLSGIKDAPFGWWLHAECLAALNSIKKRNLPEWF